MKTLSVLAASALVALTATSAFAGEARVKVRGRSDAAIHADIVSAATSICRQDLGVGPDAADAMPYCVRDVTRDAVKRAGSPTLIAYDKSAWAAGRLQRASY
ncbi:MAG: hypothetical protein J7521_16000 [Caulobacter sp.]|nr:hypothetical protein [Caulobacter sp.]